MAFRDYLAAYAASAGFAGLASDTARLKGDLAQIMYQVRIKGPRVEVSRYDGEPDYRAPEIQKTFDLMLEAISRHSAGKLAPSL